MFKRELLKNKLYGAAMISLGALSSLFFSEEN